MSLSERARMWLLMWLFPELPQMFAQCSIDGVIPPEFEGTVAHEYVKLAFNFACLIGLVEEIA